MASKDVERSASIRVHPHVFDTVVAVQSETLESDPPFLPIEVAETLWGWATCGGWRYPRGPVLDSGFAGHGLVPHPLFFSGSGRADCDMAHPAPGGRGGVWLGGCAVGILARC